MLAWNPSLAIGIAEIDTQHRELFERAIRLEAAVKAGEPSHRLEELFSYLEGYVQTHFETEERFMRDRAYPHLARHLREHADFKRRLRSLVPHWETEGGSPALVMALLGLLEFWLTDHIGKSDRDIGDFLK